MKKINLGQKEIIHFVGIGGIGMSGLAQIMKNMGFRIQGSDQSKTGGVVPNPQCRGHGQPVLGEFVK